MLNEYKIQYLVLRLKYLDNTTFKWFITFKVENINLCSNMLLSITALVQLLPSYQANCLHALQRWRYR